MRVNLSQHPTQLHSDISSPIEMSSSVAIARLQSELEELHAEKERSKIRTAKLKERQAAAAAREARYEIQHQLAHGNENGSHPPSPAVASAVHVTRVTGVRRRRSVSEDDNEQEQLDVDDDVTKPDTGTATASPSSRARSLRRLDSVERRSSRAGGEEDNDEQNKADHDNEDVSVDADSSKIDGSDANNSAALSTSSIAAASSTAATAASPRANTRSSASSMRGRNARMFAGLLGILRGASSRLTAERRSEVGQRQSAIQQRINHKLEEQSSTFKATTEAQEREKVEMEERHQQRVEKKAWCKHLELLSLLSAEHRHHLSHFFTTQTSPSLHWLPAHHSDVTTKLMEQQKAEYERRAADTDNYPLLEGASKDVRWTEEDEKAEQEYAASLTEQRRERNEPVIHGPSKLDQVAIHSRIQPRRDIHEPPRPRSLVVVPASSAAANSSSSRCHAPPRSATRCNHDDRRHYPDTQSRAPTHSRPHHSRSRSRSSHRHRSRSRSRSARRRRKESRPRSRSRPRPRSRSRSRHRHRRRPRSRSPPTSHSRSRSRTPPPSSRSQSRHATNTNTTDTNATDTIGNTTQPAANGRGTEPEEGELVDEEEEVEATTSERRRREEDDGED